MFPWFLALMAGVGAAGGVAGSGGGSSRSAQPNTAQKPVVDALPPVEQITEPEPEPEPEPAPAPTPEPEPEPAPEPEPEPAPEPEPDTGDGSDDEVQEPILPRSTAENSGDGPTRIEAQAFSSDETIAVAGGRTTTLRLDTEKEISSIEITDKPSFGNVTMNPDNSFALVLSGTDDKGALSFGYKVTFADGTTRSQTAEFDVQTPTQGAGWGMGEHYMLETDADGDVIVETGDNHRKVYVSESDDALSLSDIAALEGISVDNIDGKWLMENSDYGASEDMALASDAGMALWYGLTGSEQEPNSHWLLFEKGYTYTDLGKVVTRGTTGESELHPVHITSYGEGTAPVLDTSVAISQLPSQNIVMSDLKVLNGVGVKDASNVLMSDLELVSDGMGIRDSDHITLHDSSISYAVTDAEDGSGVTQGLLGVNSSNLLIEGNVFHHNGWLDGYNMDGTGHAPDQFSHNVYLQWSTSDVTFRDNISSQSSSIGAQLRGGAYAEDNLFLDNNVAVNFLGGNYKDFGHVGNFTYFADNVITSGSYKDAQSGGAKGWGASNGGYDTTMLDNIFAHLADPDDPADLEAKQVSTFAVAQKEDASFFYEDTKVLNWLGANPIRWKDAAMDRNLEGTDIDRAMETTIQRYADQLTDGQTATISGLMDYILDLSETTYDDVVTARVIVDYFQTGFGIEIDQSADADAHRFVPNDLAAGVRWDNEINWDSGELPTDGDQVDLAGNWVQFGAMTSRIDDLDIGAGGWLNVSSGLLEVGKTLSTGDGTGQVSIDGAGQFWTDGYGDEGVLAVDAAGGRFANTGTVTGDVDIRVSDNAQAILATDNGSMVLSAESELRIEGSDANAGFDGDGTGPAILQMADAATLSFVADAEGFSTLEEFRSGAWDQDGSPVQSGVSMDGVLQIDLSAYEGGVGTHELIRVDALQGMFDEVRIHGLQDGLQAETVIDFGTDMLTLDISSGNGGAGVSIIGDADSRGDEARALWDALTAGQGVFEDTPPQIIEEEEELEPLF